jgi:hypothetical protein
VGHVVFHENEVETVVAIHVNNAVLFGTLAENLQILERIRGRQRMTM